MIFLAVLSPGLLSLGLVSALMRWGFGPGWWEFGMPWLTLTGVAWALVSAGVALCAT